VTTVSRYRADRSSVFRASLPGCTEDFGRKFPCWRTSIFRGFRWAAVNISTLHYSHPQIWCELNRTALPQLFAGLLAQVPVQSRTGFGARLRCLCRKVNVTVANKAQFAKRALCPCPQDGRSFAPQDWLKRVECYGEAAETDARLMRTRRIISFQENR